MSIQIVEKSGEGLSRVFGVTVPMGELTEKLAAKIAEVRPQVQLKGFRPGKVPASHVRKMYGRAMMGEIVEQAMNDSQQQAMTDAKLRPAAQPEVKLQSDIERVMAGEADLSYELAVEIMPEFEPTDLAAVTLTRPVHTPADEELEAELTQLAEQNRTYEDKPALKGEEGGQAAAAEGDMVVGDFVGRIDGETFEGGSAEGAEIVVGSDRFIPGFERQLIGAKVGDVVKVEVTFPEAYAVETLRGKPAVFDVTVNAVRAPREAAIDDALATTVGFDSLDSLKNAVRTQLEQSMVQASRFKAKRALLDVLDQRHAFPLPPRMVDAEFEVIWRQVEAERASGEASDEDAGKPDEQLRAEYRKIAERRVRLGLVLAEIGRRENVTVTDQELQGALMNEARRYPGQEREVFEFYRQNQQAQAQLRAPVYEEKVVDLILTRAQVTDEEVSREALFEDDDLPEGYGEEPSPKANAEPAETPPQPTGAEGEQVMPAVDDHAAPDAAPAHPTGAEGGQVMPAIEAEG